ncbi:MAG: Na(+)/H(+) antiporter subunit B [Magnetococcales bacterium]|nr:Na(+)/H(+) antiporter subunit B [Magnetococcales bacterium]
MKNQAIYREVAKLMMPFILMFAMYVQFHGDFGPGGGFQAGVILAVVYILYALVFGLGNARHVTPMTILRFMLAFGVLLYAGVGMVTMFMGGQFLDYNVLSHDPAHGQHLGVFLVELGVGISVAAAMITIFFVFSGQEH